MAMCRCDGPDSYAGPGRPGHRECLPRNTNGWRLGSWSRRQGDSACRRDHNSILVQSHSSAARSSTERPLSKAGFLDASAGGSAGMSNCSFRSGHPADRQERALVMSCRASAGLAAYVPDPPGCLAREGYRWASARLDLARRAIFESARAYSHPRQASQCLRARQSGALVPMTRALPGPVPRQKSIRWVSG
jgi:hypothetical protein